MNANKITNNSPIHEFSNECLSDIESFKHKIPNPDMLIFWVKKFPENADNLIKPLLTNLAVFKYYVWNSSYFLEIAKHFRQHTDALIQPLLTNRAEFKRLVCNTSYFVEIVKKFPLHTDALIQYLLSDLEEFKRIVYNEDSHQYMARNIPKYDAIVGNVTRETVIQNILYSDKAEIIKNIRILSQARRNEGNLFHSYAIPDELLVEIASHTSNSSIHSEKEASDIAFNNAGKPPRRVPNYNLEWLAKDYHFSRQDLIEFAPSQLRALVQLRPSGLTAAHFRAHPEFVGDNYKDALVSLMIQRGDKNKSADQAIAALVGLNDDQVRGVADGANAEDVIGLYRSQTRALLALQHQGMTRELLLSHPPRHQYQYIGDHYRDALVHLMTKRGINNMTADQALVEVDGLDEGQIRGIASGLDREDVRFLSWQHVVTLIPLKQHGLTAPQLQEHPFPNMDYEYYRDAMINLMTQRGVNNKTGDQALAEIDGLRHYQVLGIANGLNREDVENLHEQQIGSFLALREHGLTLKQLESIPQTWQDSYYQDALINLMTKRGSNNRTADQAIAELKGLNPRQTERISKGETIEVVKKICITAKGFILSPIHTARQSTLEIDKNEMLNFGLRNI